jgi:hypothetical protein
MKNEEPRATGRTRLTCFTGFSFFILHSSFFISLLLLCGSSSGQNLLQNPGFESAIDPEGSSGTTNWTIVYQYGNAEDFSVAGRSTMAASGATNSSFGGHIRARHGWFAHAYLKQVVTNLTAAAAYTLTCGKMQSGFKYTDEGDPPNLSVYASLISGSFSNAVHGYSTNSGPYSLSITCSASRQIEVQLHVSKKFMTEGIEDVKYLKCSGWFDNFSLTNTP